MTWQRSSLRKMRHQYQNCRSYASKLIAGCLIFLPLFAIGCSSLHPKAIESERIYAAPELVGSGPQVQRGEPRKVIDAVGWVLGAPSKILLWDRRVDNHNVGHETEAAIVNYLDANGLDTVRVRVNQYRPGEDWGRLVDNKAVGAPWRYTLGALSVIGETIIPGRLFGGDHYNPFTNTVHLYSDVPAIALHEGAHAKDFARRKFKGSYAFAYLLPVVPLYHESLASRDATAYVDMFGSTEEQAESRRILYPAYGTYVGSAAGSFVPKYANPLYYGSVIAGHAWGRYEAKQINTNSESALAAPTAGAYTVRNRKTHSLEVQPASATSELNSADSQ